MAGPATLYQAGIHADRPAAGSGCVLYSCTTHGLVYRDSGTAWATFMTLVSGIASTLPDAKGDLITATAPDAPAILPVGANGSTLLAASGESTGLRWRLNNDGAAAAPATTDDSGDGYSVGSRWLDTTADKEYVCLDASVGAAVWVETTASVGAGGGTLLLAPTSDTHIDSQSVTTNNDAATTMSLGNTWGTASFTRFPLLTFDITPLVGMDVSQAVLWLYRTDATAAQATDRRMEARRVLRAYVPAEVTWNVFSTGNAWTTVGARDVGTDIELARVMAHSPIGASTDADMWHFIDLVKLVQATLDASQTTMRVALSSSVNGSGSNVMNLASLNHATPALRPKMLVTYS